MKANAKSPTNGHALPGVSVRMGPIEEDEMDIDKPANGINGSNGTKRKTSMPNGKSYKDASDSEDDLPLVCTTTFTALVRF